jgi:hypothetical protein
MFGVMSNSIFFWLVWVFQVELYMRMTCIIAVWCQCYLGILARETAINVGTGCVSMEMEMDPQTLRLSTNLQVCCGCHPPSLLLPPPSTSAAAATTIQLCCCCCRHLSLLPPAFAILEGTPWAFHHQQDV